MRRIINQSNFPKLWLFFQYTVGGNFDKKKLILQTYHEEKRILEVGCSVGNLAEAFLSVQNISYHGIDVDQRAIDFAQHRFETYDNFKFICDDLAHFRHYAQPYDLIYFAGVLHHVPDQIAISLLQSASALLKQHARICIIEPRAASLEDPKLVRWYAGSLEEGKHLRSADALQNLVRLVKGLEIQSEFVAPIHATPFSWPLCANFIVIELAESKMTEGNKLV